MHLPQNLLRTFYAILLLLITGSGIAYGQTASIQGRVTDVEQEPIPGINIILEGTTYGAAADHRGYYKITDIPAGTYTIVASGVGFQSERKAIELTAGETVSVDVKLSASNNALQAIVVQGDKVNTFAQKNTSYVARMPLNNLENPQVYSVIPDEIMEEQLITDIQGAIQNAPGINNAVESVGSGGVGLNVTMRGFHTGISLRNGMATNYKTMSDPANIQRIEVIKGPSATLFGSTLISYGGLINLVTKKPLENFKGSVGYSTGSFGLSRLTADVNTPLNDDKTVLFRINAAVHHEESFQDEGQQRNWALYPNLLYKVNDRLTLNIEAELYHTNRPSNYFRINPGVPVDGFDGLSYNFNHSYSSDQLQSQADVFNIYASATYELSNQWVSTTNYSYGNTDNNANYLFLTFLDKSRVRRMPMHITSKFNTLQIQQNFLGNFKIGSLKNKLLVGFDFTHLKATDRRTRFVYDTVSNTSQNLDFNYKKYEATLAETPPYYSWIRNNNTYSAYISDVINFTNRLFVMASLRVDYFSNEVESFEQLALSPKFGAVYQIVEDKISLFANFMDGFNNVAPDNTDPTNIITFEPEHATQLEGGIKTRLFNNRLSATISYYDITVRNIVRSVPNPDNIGGFNSVQDGTRSSRGFEIELITNPLAGWNIVAGYGYNDSKYTKAEADIEGNRPYSTPEHSLNFWTSYKLNTPQLHGLGFGFGGNYVSESYLGDANLYIIPAHTVLNATVFFDRPRFRVGVKLNNIGDEEYWVSNFWARPQETRNVVANLKIKF